jgi:cytochrome c nitrite reductase small subunit
VNSAARLAIAAAIAAGLAVGLGAFTFGYAQGHSYLSNDAAACANCHIMTEHFDAWRKSSHSAIATCNDCHTPHNIVGKYLSKAQNGFWHSFYFTTGRYPDPLRITERNQQVTEAACRRCHAAITEAIDPHPVRAALFAGSQDPAQLETSCVRCHAHVGHLVR